MKRFQFYFSILLLSLLILACNEGEIFGPDEAYTMEELAVLSVLDIPEIPHSYGFGNLDQSDKLDYVGTLGRVLFYDNQLSVDGSVSCASCHSQSLAFADNKILSVGAEGNVTERNSIALGSVRSFGAHYEDLQLDDRATPGLFWDERANSIKEQIKETINNPNEMGMSLEEIKNRVNKEDYYKILSSKAFGYSEMTEDNILDALEVFIKSINSRNSVFESEVLGDLNYISGDSIAGMTDLAIGFQLFEANCSTCHSLNLSLKSSENAEQILVANNGLVLEGADLGVYNHSQIQEDIGKFKVPGLRNIALTAPYMHDGRFSTLDEVVDFYDSGINMNANLHPSLTENGQPKRMNFTASEKAQLVQFLESLTDEGLATEEKWSNPFM